MKMIKATSTKLNSDRSLIRSSGSEQDNISSAKRKEISVVSTKEVTSKAEKRVQEAYVKMETLHNNIEKTF